MEMMPHRMVSIFWSMKGRCYIYNSIWILGHFIGDGNRLPEEILCQLIWSCSSLLRAESEPVRIKTWSSCSLCPLNLSGTDRMEPSTARLLYFKQQTLCIAMPQSTLKKVFLYFWSWSFWGVRLCLMDMTEDIYPLCRERKWDGIG